MKCALICLVILTQVQFITTLRFHNEVIKQNDLIIEFHDDVIISFHQLGGF